jgi:hypothetical protein
MDASGFSGRMLIRSLGANIVVAATTNVARVITGLSCELSLGKLFVQRDGVSRRGYDGRGAAALEKRTDPAR